ncbi:MAG: response regulator [Pseudomonadota bacterium]
MANIGSEATRSKILLVDDDPIMRTLASAKLQEAGHEVTAVENGAEGVAALARAHFDLVIADLDMPVMDGFQLTQNIRMAPSLKDIPVIVVTGSDQSDAVESAFAAGATSFLAKPINWTLFSHSVRFVLRASEGERALRTARDEAQAGARFKDNLLSMMSHELRTPLNAIIGFGQILGEKFNKASDPLHEEYASYIVEGGRRLLSSISDMLLASDAATGPISIGETECDVADLVEAAVSDMRGVLNTAETKLKVVNDSNDAVICDQALVVRALGKLIDNAVKFSDKGAAVTVGATSLDNGSLVFFVRDQGPGINDETLHRVLQPFSQSDMSLRRSKEGLGLGLPLVIAISEAHGAMFKLISQPEGGAQAVIIFPPRRVVGARCATESLKIA